MVQLVATRRASADANVRRIAEGRRQEIAYCTSRAEGAFGEMIARYRERPGLLQRIDAFLTGRPDPEYDPLLSPG